MSVDSLLDAIRTEGESRVHTIEVETRIRVEDTIAKAQADAQRLQDEARASMIASANRERARRLQSARLDAVKIKGEVYEELITDMLQNVRQYLSQVRATNAYSSILRQLVQEALQELDKSLRGNETVLLEADPRDRQALGEILQELDRDLYVNDTLNTLGGVIASSEDGRVTVLNTLESRLARAIPHLRSNLLTLLADTEASSLHT